MVLNYMIYKMYRMNGTEIDITQGVSQMSGPTIVPLADDLLQTQRMTIENLIESTEVILYCFFYYLRYITR